MLSHEYDEGVCTVVKRLETNNQRLQLKVVNELIKYKSSRRPPTNKTQQRLYYKSIQQLRDNLFTDLGLQLITYRLKQFAMWFSYMYHMPTITLSVYERLRHKYPYKTHHFLRQVRVLIPKPLK